MSSFPEQHICVLVVALLVALPALGAPNDEQAEVVCPRATGAITVDGKPDEPAWEDAVSVGPMVTLGALTVPDTDRTSAKLLHDDTALYLAVTCGAAEAEPLPEMRRDDGRIWRHDHLELFLDASPDTEDYFHLLVDRRGNVFDSWRAPEEVTPRNERWNGDWQVAVAETPEGWTAEFAIPFAALDADPLAPGALWRFKLGRDAGADGPIMWPPNPSRGFHTREVDAALYFDTMNLLRNPGFEEGELGEGAPEPWGVNLTSAEVDNKPQGEVHTVEGGIPPGKRALQFTKLATALWWPQVWDYSYQLEPGGTYEFSIMVKGTMPQVNIRATARVEGTSVKMSEGRKPNHEEFTRQGFAFIVPQGASEVGVGLSAPAAAGGTVLYDNAVLRRLLYAPDAVERKYFPPDWSPDPDPIHGLAALCERAGHKPWDLFWREDHLLTYRVMFRDRKYGTDLWLLDNSPGREHVITASIWPGWNADCSVLMLPGSRTAGEERKSPWLCNADFSRLTPMPTGSQPLWDLEDPDLYYKYSAGRVDKVNLRTGEVTELATWERAGNEYQGVAGPRSYGLTKDNRSVFVTDWDAGEWLPYEPGDEPLTYVKVLDAYGPDPDKDDRLPCLLMTTETESGPKFRVLIGTRIYTDTGRVERIIAPISGETGYLRTFASGRVQLPDHATPPATKDLEELFDIYHLYPSCSHGHPSYSPDGEYVCWDGGCSFHRVRDGGDAHSVRISSNGGCYHTCWFYDPRYFVTCVRGYRGNYDRPENGNILSQVFTDGTWQPIADIKMRFNAYYYGGNFATFSRDATKVHYESSMTSVQKNYIAVMARPQPPRELSWKAEGNAVALSWSAPPHHKEIKGYLISRSERSGDGYGLLTPEPVAGTTYRDEAVEPGRAYYYVATSLEHCGLESGYSNEAARAGVGLAAQLDAPLVVYAEAEDALVDLASSDKPGISRGRDRLGASNWYYVYRTPSAEAGSAALKVNVPADGRYYVWLRVRSTSSAPAHWDLTCGGGPPVSVEAPAEDWQWVKAQEEPVALTAGPLDLTLSTSDANAQADLICLATDAAFKPEGARPEDRQPPAAVTGLQAKDIRDRTVHLTWDPVADADLSHYSVYGSREPIAEPNQERLLASPTYAEFADWGLRAGTTYHYAVTSVDRRGNESALSAVAQAVLPEAAHPPCEIELAFDRAQLEGPFEQAEAEGTHTDKFVILPKSADAEQAAAAKVTWEVELPHEGSYYFWLRYLPSGAAGSRGAAVAQSIKTLLDGAAVTTLGGGLTDLSVTDGLLRSDAGQREPGDIRTDFWTWARPVGTDLNAVELPAGKHKLTLERLTPEIRYDTLVITNEPSYLPPDGRLRLR